MYLGTNVNINEKYALTPHKFIFTALCHDRDRGPKSISDKLGLIIGL